jgi:LPXTG-motif cell wall-anchored protein
VIGSLAETGEDDEAFLMMAMATLALGMVIFGLFFLMIAGCDRL